MTDFLTDNDFDIDISVFDDLQHNQKIAVLLGVSKALLRDNVPPPPLTAINEAAVAGVYRNMFDRLAEEIDPIAARILGVPFDEVDEANVGEDPSWRTLVLDACRAANDMEDLPRVENTDEEEWALLIDCLRGRILWDEDWEMVEQLDAVPEVRQTTNEEMGIDEDYFVSVPPDPTDEEASQMIRELQFLTPEGRGL